MGNSLELSMGYLPDCARRRNGYFSVQNETKNLILLCEHKPTSRYRVHDKLDLKNADAILLQQGQRLDFRTYCYLSNTNRLIHAYIYDAETGLYKFAEFNANSRAVVLSRKENRSGWCSNCWEEPDILRNIVPAQAPEHILQEIREIGVNVFEEPRKEAPRYIGLHHFSKNVTVTVRNV